LPLILPNYAYPLGVVQLSAFSTATGLTDVPAGTATMVFSVEGEPVRYRDDGTAPTATVGVLLPVTTGEPYVYISPIGIRSIQFIPTTGSATINAAFYR
jgi:hypothetical protein